MKCVKTLGLMAVAVAALMALVGPGTASATVLCKETCAETYPAGTKLSSHLQEGTEATFKSAFIGEVKCGGSTTEGKITNAGSSTETVSGEVTNLTFTSCNGTVTVLKTGTIETHTDGESATGNGTATATSSEVTVELAGLHCIFTTSHSDIGTIVGGTTSITEISAAPIPRTGGRSGAFCGSSALFTAKYVQGEPGPLSVQ